MASETRLIYIKCPYFINHTKQSITCEGLTEGRIVQQFNEERTRDIYEIRLCCESYHKCPIAMLLDAKYKTQEK